MKYNLILIYLMSAVDVDYKLDFVLENAIWSTQTSNQRLYFVATFVGEWGSTVDSEVIDVYPLAVPAGTTIKLFQRTVPTITTSLVV